MDLPPPHVMGFFFLATLCLLSSLSTVVHGQEDELHRAGVREVLVERPPGTKVECFRIDRGGDAPGNSPGASSRTPIGVARWISGPDPDAASTWRTELELTYFEEATRVSQVERVGPERRELVFRELRDRSGRTLHLTLTTEGAAMSRVASGGEVRRRDWAVGRGAMLPLSMVEVVRRGGKLEGTYPLFQPLSNAFERVEASVAASADERHLLVRRNGLVLGSFVFDGDGLRSFSWQSGGPVATRIEPNSLARMLAARRPLESPEPADPSEEGSGSEEETPQPPR